MARLLLRRPYTPPDSTDPYLWFPALDLNRIPWHVGAGGWGAQVPLQTPAAPTTTRQVTVHTSGNFGTEAAVAGSEITIGTGWPASTTVQINASDIDVIVPEGVSVGPILVSGTRARVRVRGEVVGEHSGGKVSQFRDNWDKSTTDVIVDGIDIDGSGFTQGTLESHVNLRLNGTRVAVVNVRGLSSGMCMLGDSRHMVVAGCSFFHGAATRADNGHPEGWGIRQNAGPFVFFDSQIRGGRYHNIRMHANYEDGSELAWIADSDFVSLSEARVLNMWNHTTDATAVGTASIVDNCRIYTHSATGCGLPFNLIASCEYSRVRNCQFFGSGGLGVGSQSYLNTQAAAAQGTPGDHDWTVNNSFASYTAAPTWRGPGDPTAIVLPYSIAFQEGEGVCPVP